VSRIVESWLNAHRLSRAVFAAVVLTGALAWMLWDRPPARLSRDQVTGTVVSAVADGATLIALPDGHHVRALTPRPLPRPGDRMPLVVETYADGTVYAVIDLDAWRTGDSAR